MVIKSGINKVTNLMKYTKRVKKLKELITNLGTDGKNV
jgi:hypothetical protein